MPRVSKFFGSNYLSAADLTDGDRQAIISNVEEAEIFGEPKLVVFFESEEKGLTLNMTNARVLAGAYGDDTRDWIGEPVVLFAVDVTVNGEAKRGVRVRIPRGAGHKPRPAPRSAREAIEDEIPF